MFKNCLFSYKIKVNIPMTLKNLPHRFIVVAIQSDIHVLIAPPPPLQINWYRTFMYSSIQNNDLAYSNGVSVCNLNHQFFQFFVFDSKTEITESLNIAAWNPVLFGYILTPSPVFVWFWRYIFIIKSVPSELVRFSSVQTWDF